MHTTPTNPSELITLREQIEIERLRLELTMIRVQTSALETLERFMEVQEPSGDEKKDKAEATKLNRQRLAATQTLIHCRTAQRESRLATTTRNTKPKPKELEPNRASDGAQASGKNTPPAPSPQTSDGANGGSPASAGPSQPVLRPKTTTKPPRKPKHPRQSRKRRRKQHRT